MGRKKNKNPPPPPRGVGSGGGGSGGGSTATPSTTASPYYSLSEIDDDESNTAPSIGRGNNNDDDSTEITDADDNTDADSILEMAKRLDAASVISDPSFIEGPENSFQHHPSRGAYRMDEIASESEEEDEDDGSSSESSSDDDESSSDDDDDDSESSSSESYDSERYGYTNRQHTHNNGKGNGSNRNRGGRRYQHRHTSSTHNSGGSGGRNDNNRRRRKKQQQHRQQGAAYDDNKRGQQQQQQQFNTYPGGDRGQRKYSPPRGGATAAAAAAAYNITSSTKHSRGSEQRSTTRGGGERRSKTSSSQKKDQQRQQQHDGGRETPKQRRTKMIVIPFVVILIIVVVVVVAVVVGKGGSGGGNATDTQNNDNINDTAFQPIPVPTVSPTYVGLYSCPYGKSGPTATKGCLGYVQCTALGTIIGEIQYCSTGTLYDVRSGVCDFAENVYCATKLPTQDEIVAAQESASTSVSPPTSGTVGVVPPPMNQPSITVGPITTYNHKLLFEGLTNPGQLNSDDMNNIATNLQDYNNIFYSARVINAYDDGDYILESIGNVTIGLTATKFEYVLNDRRVRRNLRNNFRHLQQPVGIVANGLTMEYRQTTKYDTIDESIRPGTIVRYPYSGRYQDRIVGYLKAVDPDTFSKLTRVLYVEGDVVGGIEPVPQPQPAPAPVPVANPPQPLPPTMKPTSAQTPPPSPPPAVPKTSPPTPAPVTPPPVAQKVQGFVFFDTDEDGIFDFSGGEPEETFSGVWVNLRDCDTGDWRQTEATEQQGLYSFAEVEEGEYFLEFFKPSPAEKYIPTKLPVAGSDSSVLDSDLVGSTQTGGARTACFTVGPGFDSNQFFNAGFRLAPTPPPTPSPSKSPTLTPTNMSYYCAEVSTTSAGIQNFNFLGCQIRCGNGFDECPGNTRCVFSDVCAP